MISIFINKTYKSTDDVLKSAFQFGSFEIPVDKISEYVATIFIGRIRKRFLRQENPDGSKWPESKAAKKRAAGGKTWAKGGPYAPGGWKTGTGTLFSSGNLFHSLQLFKAGIGMWGIGSDVPYSVYYMNRQRTILGVTDEELTETIKGVVENLI